MNRDKDTRQPSEKDGKTAGLTPSVAKLKRIIGPSPSPRMLTPYEIELLRKSKQESDQIKSGPDPKLTNPGPEALAILGLSLHPVFGSRNRTLTQGCSGSWKAGFYSWPLWSKPASPHVVKSLLAHAYAPEISDRDRWFRSWGIFRILRSPIRRSGKGGYGTFGPPEVAWQLRGQTKGAVNDGA